MKKDSLGSGHEVAAKTSITVKAKQEEGTREKFGSNTAVCSCLCNPFHNESLRTPLQMKRKSTVSLIRSPYWSTI